MRPRDAHASSWFWVGIGLVIGAAIALASVVAQPRAPNRARHAPPRVAARTAFAGAGAGSAADLPETAPPSHHRANPMHDEELSLEDLVARALPAVASIQAGNARGTGFFVRPDAIITNAHVIDGQTTVRLQVGDRSFAGRVMSVSPGSDLAVIQVERPNPSQVTLELGSSGRARVGQEVIAIGSALGVLSNTVTRGIVSAVRQVGPVTLVQTDAAINPGNSGGPLLDRQGMVIGVNSMAVGRQAGEGVAFAVAIDHVDAAAGQRTRAAVPRRRRCAGWSRCSGSLPTARTARARGERAARAGARDGRP